MEIVFEVEQSKDKSEPMTAAQRGVIAHDIANMPWTMDEIHRRASFVKKKNTYKSIGFEWWFNAEPVYCGEEIERELSRREAQRRRVYLDLNKIIENQEEELAKEGLTNIQDTYARKREIAFQEIQEKQDQRVKQVEQYIRTATDKTRLEIFKILKKKRLLTDEEKFWKEILHLFAPYIIHEVETIMQRTKP